ncbi:MAG: hypothetical protein R3E41_09170 [Burkholderiaceae bacterium]
MKQQAVQLLDGVAVRQPGRGEERRLADAAQRRRHHLGDQVRIDAAEQALLDATLHEATKPVQPLALVPFPHRGRGRIAGHVLHQRRRELACRVDRRHQVGLEGLLRRHGRRAARALLAQPGQVAVEHPQEQRFLAVGQFVEAAPRATQATGKLRDGHLAETLLQEDRLEPVEQFLLARRRR